MFQRLASLRRRAAVTIDALTVRRRLHTSRPLERSVPFLLADIGEGITEVEVLEWHVKEGTPVRQFDRIAEVQSDKATVEITSRYDGVVRKLHYVKGATARVGQPLVDIEVEGDAGEEETSLPRTPSKEPVRAPLPNAERPAKMVLGGGEATPLPLSVPPSHSAVKAMPGVRHLAKSRGIDIATIRGTGTHGQVTRADVLRHGTDTEASRLDRPDQSELLPLSAFQKAMVKSMQASLTIPHFGYHDELEVDQVLELRSSLLATVERDYGVRLTPMAFYLKALSLALLSYPQLNAHYEPAAGAVRRHAAHNIGLAVDTDHGLAVPVLRNACGLSIIEIAREINRLVEAARSNRLASSDLTEGTITVSNVGSIGGTTASPVILSPQVAIVALGKAQRLPRFDAHQQVVGRTIMPISWSADHRIVDGATVARFTQRWRELVERPAAGLLLHLTQP